MEKGENAAGNGKAKGISANNDVLELTTGKSPWSDSIRNQVSRMDGLLQSMLALTKLDAQRPTLQMEQLDFSSLVSQAAEPFCVLAETNQVSLSVQVEAEVCIFCDATSLRQLVSILLENAVKYAGPNGTVVVQLEKQGKFTRLWVENTCSELPSGNLNRLFDRFYRADTSRSPGDRRIWNWAVHCQVDLSSSSCEHFRRSCGAGRDSVHCFFWMKYAKNAIPVAA